MLRMLSLVLVSWLLAAAPPSPTLGPIATGSMYNGNNAQPPKLQDTGNAAAEQNATKAEEGQDTTGAHVTGGRGAAQGGGG